MTQQTYTCSALGDFETYLTSNDASSGLYCQSCRGLFPGCKRCLSRSGSPETEYFCAACDEGMYLMPSYEGEVAMAYNQSPYEQKLYPIVCVPDCPTANWQFVNNPELGKCEFLGHYCKYGNHIEGCKESYLQGSKTQLVDRPTNGLTVGQNGYFWDQVSATTFKISQISDYISNNQEYVSQPTPSTPGQITLDNCITVDSMSNPAKCSKCTTGYLFEEDKDMNTINTNCVLRCGDGYYPSIMEDAMTQKISDLKCRQCDPSCGGCLFTSTQCTSCPDGKYLQISDVYAKTGVCISKSDGSTNEFNIVVTGDRNTADDSMTYRYQNLISALKQAYTLGLQFKGSTVNVKMDPTVTHYITISDLRNDVSSDFRYFQDAQYTLNILPYGCSGTCTTYVDVKNKVGSRLKILAPIMGFTMQNIRIDSIDSVVDPTYDLDAYSCANSYTSTCCQTTGDLSYLQCINGMNSVGAYFNKYDACNYRPVSSLIYMLSSSSTNLYDPLTGNPDDPPFQQTVTIKSCTFKNFFHEINSIVRFPQVNDESSTSIFLSTYVLLEDNTFENFNTCGSVLSNNENFFESLSQLNSIQSSRFKSTNYLTYAKSLSSYRDTYIERFFPKIAKQYSSWNYNVLSVKRNQFISLNLLKDPRTEVDNFSSLRNEYLATQVPQISERNRGFAIDIYGGLFGMGQTSKIEVEENQFQKTVQPFRTKNTDPQITVEKTHCGTSLDSPKGLQNALYQNDMTKYFQFHHMISIKEVSNVTFNVESNTFYNQSLVGPLIYFSEKQDARNSTIIMYKNTIDYMFIFIGSAGVLQVQRYAQGGETFYTQDLAGELSDMWAITIERIVVNSAAFTGSILIQENTISRVMGCTLVDNTLFSITYTDAIVNNKESQISDLFKRNLPSLDNLLTSFTTQAAEFQTKYAPGYITRYVEDMPGTIKKIRTGKMLPTEDPLELSPLSTRFISNKYDNVLMGVSQTVSGQMLRGTLIRLNNVIQADFINEEFSNIGAFSVEALNEYTLVQWGEYSYHDNKPILNLLTFYYNPKYDDFFQNEVSSGLIYANSIIRLRILENCKFTNIWLIDNYKAYLNAETTGTLHDTGLIAYVTNMRGELIVGGNRVSLSETQTFQTKFTEMVGFINSNTIPRYKRWDPLYLQTSDPEPLSKYEITHGLGSIMFNVMDSSNEFQLIEFKYLSFTKIHAKPYNTISGTQSPMIISTTINSVDSNPVANFTLFKTDISDVQYERGNGFFHIEADEVLIVDVTAKNIGSYSILNDPLFIPWSANTRYSLTPSPFFRFVMYLESQQKFSHVNVRDSTFQSFDKNNGLPVFEVDFGTSTDDSWIDFNSHLNITDCNFLDSLGSGTADNSILEEVSGKEIRLNITFDSCLFQNISASNGLISISSLVDQVTFTDCDFKNNMGQTASIFYFSSKVIKGFNVEKSRFSNKEYTYVDIQTIILNGPYTAFKEASMIALSGSQDITLSSITVSDVHYAETASFIYLSSNGIAEIKDSSFEDMSALSAGAIYVSKSTLTISDTKFKRIGAVSNGVMNVADESKLTITDCTFTGNYAQQNGVFKIQGDSIFQIEDTLINYNLAELQNSVGQILQISGTSYFKNVKFSSNSAFISGTSSGGAALEIISCDGEITFTDCVFKDNNAKSSTPNVNALRGKNITFDGCSFYNTDKHIKNSTVKGGFIQLVAQSYASIIDSSFLAGYAYQGGAIYLLGDSSVKIDGSDFEDNYAETQGGAISAESFRSIEITGKSRFMQNKANTSNGDVLQATNSIYYVVINDATMSSQYGSNFMDISDVTNVTMVGIKVFHNNGYKLTKVNTVGVSLTRLQQLLITNSTFSNLRGNSDSYGGALRLSSGDQDLASTQSYIIANSTFSNSTTSVNGGAIALVNMPYTLINNCTFYNNSAEGEGGAIYFCCTDYGRNFQKCNMTLQDSKLVKNQATMYGGGLKWNFYEPKMVRVTYEQNTALVYGNDIASVAKQLVRIQQNQTDMTSFTVSKRMLAENSKDQLASGGTLNLYFVLLDKYGQVITSDYTSKLLIKVTTSTTSIYTPLIESATQVVCYKGLFRVENMVFVSEPNTTQSLEFSTDGINTNIPDNQKEITLGNLQSTTDGSSSSSTVVYTTDEKLQIQLEIRSCQDGEEMLPSGKCQNCSEGQYLLSSPNEPTLCKDCPSSEVAECLGGNKIFPIRGYWRTSAYSENFIKCRNDVACIGRNGSDLNFCGACQHGYQGTLCADCQVGYSRSGSEYQCAKCPERRENILKLGGMLILLILLLIILVRSNIQGAMKKKSLLSVFIRIIMNHFQLLTLTASFDLEWPRQLYQFFVTFTPVSEVTTQFLSVDCFLDRRTEASASTSIAEVKLTSTESQDTIDRVFFQKLMVLALAPFLIFIFSWIVWNAIFFIQARLKKNDKTQKTPQGNELTESTQQISIMNAAQEKHLLNETKNGRIITTIIVILFLIHPTVTKAMFNAFNCQNIDNERRLYEDLEVICYQSKHQIVAFGVALPSLLIWGLGIPTVGVLLIFQNRKEINSYEVKSRYGFLYSGYRQPNAIYWEFIIMYRKIILIFIQVFLQQTGKIVQALITLLFLILYLSLQAFTQPFTKSYLNRLEQFSILTSTLTVYCGLFFIANTTMSSDNQYSMTEETKVFLFILIVLSHLIFGLYWLYHFLQEMRSTIRAKAQKLYMTFFLCCSQRKLDMELQRDQYNEKMAPFLGQIDSIVEYLQNRRDLYEKGDIPFEDNEFKVAAQQFTLLVKEVQKSENFSKKFKSQNYLQSKFLEEEAAKNYKKLRKNNQTSWRTVTDAHPEDKLIQDAFRSGLRSMLPLKSELFDDGGLKSYASVKIQPASSNGDNEELTFNHQDMYAAESIDDTEGKLNIMIEDVDSEVKMSSKMKQAALKVKAVNALKKSGNQIASKLKQALNNDHHHDKKKITAQDILAPQIDKISEEFSREEALSESDEAQSVHHRMSSRKGSKGQLIKGGRNRDTQEPRGSFHEESAGIDIDEDAIKKMSPNHRTALNFHQAFSSELNLNSDSARASTPATNNLQSKQGPPPPVHEGENAYQDMLFVVAKRFNNHKLDNRHKNEKMRKVTENLIKGKIRENRQLRKTKTIKQTKDQSFVLEDDELALSSPNSFRKVSTGGEGSHPQFQGFKLAPQVTSEMEPHSFPSVVHFQVEDLEGRQSPLKSERHEPPSYRNREETKHPAPDHLQLQKEVDSQPNEETLQNVEYPSTVKHEINNHNNYLQGKEEQDEPITAPIFGNISGKRKVATERSDGMHHLQIAKLKVVQQQSSSEVYINEELQRMSVIDNNLNE